MNKYWLMSMAFFSVLLVSTVYIRTTAIAEGLVLGENTRASATSMNPTEYIRRLTEAPIRKLTEEAKRPTINPTDYVRKLTEAPMRKLTEGARRPTINPTEYIKMLTGAPENLNEDAQSKKLTGKPTPNLTQQAEHTQRLTDKKLKACQEKSSSILKRSTQLAEMATKMEEKFTSIVEGVKAYYVKNGFSLSNYNELIATIQTRKDRIAPLLDTTKADVAGFSCTGDNPAEQLNKFWQDMKAVIASLQDYRSSIKDLIVAVKGIQPGEQHEPTASPSGTL